MLSRHAIRRHCSTLLSVAIALPITMVAMLVPLTVWAAEPASPPAPELGRPGQVVLPELAGVRSGVPLQFGGLAAGPSSIVIAGVGWGGVFGYSRTQQEYQTAWNGMVMSGKEDTESLWVAPAADIFVTSRVSIGLSAGFLWARRELVLDGLAGLSEAYSIAVAPRVGYLVPVGRGFSFWPRLSVAFSYAEAGTCFLPVGPFMGEVNRTFGASLDLGLVYHPTQRLIFKLAPQIGVGRSMFERVENASLSRGEGTRVRVGGEATVGVVL